MADNEMRIKIVVDQSQYQSAMKNMGQQQGNLIKGFGAAGKAGGLFGKQVAGGMNEATGSVNKGVKAWSSFNTGFGTVTAALSPFTLAMQAGGKAIGAAGGFIKSSLSDYATFESTLKQVQIIAGGTDADMKLLSETAIKLGANTSIGAQEVANAEMEFAKLGFTASETAQAMTGIVYAAEASGSSMETTSNIVAAALNTWNLGATEAEHVADVLAMTSNKTAADMTDLGYTFQYAGASAKLGGASMEQLAAYTGIMADQGIKGSKAGTTLRTAFTNLTAPTDKAAAALDSLGISLEDADGKARPIPAVIEDLQDATQNLSDSEILDLSTKLFGKTGAAGMSMVLKRTKEETRDLTNELVNSTGTAAEQASKMRETLAGQLDQIGDGFNALKLKIGQALTPLATDGAKVINSVLDSLTHKVDQAAISFKGFTEGANFQGMIGSFGELGSAAGELFGKMMGSGGFRAIADDVVRFTTDVADAGTTFTNFLGKSGGVVEFFDDLQNQLQETSRSIAEVNPLAKELNKLFGGDQSGKVEDQATKLSKFADAVGAMNVNMRDIQTDPFYKLFNTQANSQMELVASTMKKLNEEAANFSLIDETQVTAFKTASSTIQEELGSISSKVAVENAKIRQDPNYNPSAALSQSIMESLPNLQSSLEVQVDTLRAAGEKRISVITESLSKQTAIEQEGQDRIITAVSAANVEMVAAQELRNTEMINITRNLGNMEAGERANALNRLLALERQSNQAVIDQARIKSESVVDLYRAEAEASGNYTGQAKETAINNAKAARDEQVKAAQDTYVQTKASYLSMSNDQIAKTGYTRDQLINNAYKTMVETVQSANTMKTQTVSQIQGIQDKAHEADGTTITTKSATEGFESTYERIRQITREDGRVVTIRTRILGADHANSAAVGPVGPLPVRKARGGLTSGVSLGMGSGSATSHAGASAMGIGTQLGQGGISQGGVITNERGREVTMPVSNATYMRPFARAIADELGASGLSGGAQEIVVPVYLNGREFAIATNKDMTTEQTKYKAMKNRAKGK